MEELIHVSEVLIQYEQTVWVLLFCFGRASFIAAPGKTPGEKSGDAKAGGELISAVAKQNRERSLDQDLNIEPDRPAARVPQIETNHLIEAYAAAPVHLP
jgi:hypothetical protein